MDEPNNTPISVDKSDIDNLGQSCKPHQFIQPNPQLGQVDVLRLLRPLKDDGGNLSTATSEQNARGAGVIFRGLTVVGKTRSVVEQTTSGDPLLNTLRVIRRWMTKGKWSNPAAHQQPPLLEDIDGCIWPGEMLLVLGRPGAGCSTLLKVLGNQRDGYSDISGTLKFGGMDAAEVNRKGSGTISYNPEEDLHFATLNVKQTLDFAIRSKAKGSSSYTRQILNGVTQLFWIQHTLHTRVGSAFIRGISGGERKRVSIAEALVTNAAVQMWDNSTRGLDSSSALAYIAALRSLTDAGQISTAAALYQAGETLYEAFDKVILLDDGKCLYFGPTSEARQHFVDLGFEDPENLTTADFLISMANPHERRARAGHEGHVPHARKDFVLRYRESELYRRNIQDIEELEASVQAQDVAAEDMTHKTPDATYREKKYATPFWRQVLTCAQRQSQIIWGDKASLFGKWGGILFQSLVVGSLFYNTPDTSNGVFLRGGVVFFLLLFNMVLGGAETIAGFDAKPIMLKHKSFSFHRPAALAVAQFLLDAPMVLAQVLLFELVIYFLSNLGRTAHQFFLSVLCLWLATLVMYSLFRATAAIFRSLDMALGFAGVTVQLLILYIGYVIPPASMRPWFKWIIYVNPLQYAFEVLIINEFSGKAIQCVPPQLIPYGPGTEPTSQSCALAGSTLGNSVVSGSDYVHALGYSYSHVWRNIGILVAFCAFNVALTVVGMETSGTSAGGVWLRVFKRGCLPSSTEHFKSHSTSLPSDDEQEWPPSKDPVSVSSRVARHRTESSQAARRAYSFAFQGVSLTVPTPNGQQQLLRSIEGVVSSGNLTALMGSSGAGKTTLLNCLAQRSVQRGDVEGSFRVNGRPLPKSFRRKVGYAEQMDLHEETSTVLEALRFSAVLRQPATVPVMEKYAYCDYVLDILELRDAANAVIGIAGQGLSSETRKLVTIAVELAAKPETLLFLDEPTSGLDSAAAYNVIRALRKLADTGLAVLCTIHQPSSNLLDLFDDLLLLGSGGRCVYNGPLGYGARNMIDYFESQGAAPCAADANPAEYMLTSIGAGNPDYRGPDWADMWALSKEHRVRVGQITRAMETPPATQTDTSVSDDSNYYAASFLTQTLVVLRRAFTAQWRKPEYTYGKIVIQVSCALFNGFTFYKAGFASQEMQSRLFSIFLVLAVAPPLVQQLQPPFMQSRTIFACRENQSRMYSWLAWTIGAVVVELPLSILAGTLYFVSWWFCSLGVTQPSSSAAGYMWLMVQVYELYCVSYGQMFAAFTPSELLASMLSTAFFLFTLSFCGAFVPYNAVPTFWRSWIVWANPYHYMLEGMLTVAVHGLPVVCKPEELSTFPPPAGKSCEQYAASFIAEAGGYVKTGNQGLCELCAYASGDQFAAGASMFYDHRWRNVGISLAFVAFNTAVVFLATWLKFDGRKLLPRIAWKPAYLGKRRHTTLAASTDPAQPYACPNGDKMAASSSDGTSGIDSDTMR